ncbi:hypothetical protein [Rhizobium leguminosarum]|uniref:hypothetical protein n=1 Tax=Rhizobium leguminosarum TaxID=384 RepID=UPI0015FB9FAE|nr:hypothetical protein [Rhizobium leguminosarum]MBA9034338.1 hypothetical protein [Rhizobium leguminosarum]
MGAACNSVWIWEAVWIWLHGSKLDGYCIFGMSTVWIGRIAKIASFLAAMTIIIDIMGEQKVHELGISIKGRVTGRRSKLDEFIRDFNLAIDGHSPTYAGEGVMNAVFAVLALAVAGYVGWFFWERSITWYWWFLVTLLLLVVFVLVTVLLILFTEQLVRWTADLLFQAERVLANPDLCRRLRIWAASVFVISFIVDLFMS